MPHGSSTTTQSSKVKNEPADDDVPIFNAHAGANDKARKTVAEMRKTVAAQKNNEKQQEIIKIAGWNFTPEIDEEIELVAGESYTVFQVFGDQGEWTLVENKQGEVGLVPSAYLI